jgi:hypothetical protein
MSNKVTNEGNKNKVSGVKVSDYEHNKLEQYADIFHNYIRKHEDFDGKAPAEACRTKIEDENKWILLI